MKLKLLIISVVVIMLTRSQVRICGGKLKEPSTKEEFCSISLFRKKLLGPRASE